VSEPKDVLARKLAHDVGKYVTRAARNLPKSGPIPGVIVDMLWKDVFGTLPSGLTPSEEFELSSHDLGVVDPRLDDVRQRFARIAALERELAGGTELVVRSIAADALAIEQALLSLARDLSREGTSG
jgi:hypothetical protein